MTSISSIKMANSKKKSFLAFIAIASVLNYVFFYNLTDAQFLFIADQFYRFSYVETFKNSFFIRKLENLSVLNCWQLVTQFWDVVYYFLAYKLNLSSRFAERTLFFIVLLFSMILSYVGFLKVKHIHDIKDDGISIFAVTLWYCFNPYTLSLWHGGVYNIGSGLAYSLAPLIYYYFHVSVFSYPVNLQNIFICALLLFLASFTFWLFAGLAFSLLLYSFFYISVNRGKFFTFIKNSLILFLIYIPLVSFIVFVILYEFNNNSGDANSSYSPTFGNQQGGIWYSLLLIFSWGIYTTWTPRTLYSFGDYFFSLSYIIPTLLIYVIVLVGILMSYKSSIKNVFSKTKNIKYFFSKFTGKEKSEFHSRHHESKKKNLLAIFLLIFFSAVFFSKAAQPPLGEIFLYLYDHFTFFKIFRSADVRFGFIVVLSLSMLLLIASNQFNKYVFSFLIFIIILFQSFPFLSGSAIRGENIGTSYYDRIISISEDYRNVISFLNSESQESGYILPIPAIEYGHYVLGDEEHHFGQDLLSKEIERPFLYLSVSTGIFNKSYIEIGDIIKRRDYKSLRNFPIKYLLLRRDVVCESCINPTEEELNREFRILYKNKLFSVYRVDGFVPMVNSDNISFRAINPVKYQVKFNNIAAVQNLNFMLSFNKDWKLFIRKPDANCNNSYSYEQESIKECLGEMKLFEGEELSYLWKRPLFEDSHKLSNGYANKWAIDPEYVKRNSDKYYYHINDDGTINFELIIYYQPQSWFYLFLIISVIFLLLTFGFILLKKDVSLT